MNALDHTTLKLIKIHLIEQVTMKLGYQISINNKMEKAIATF